jgi:hypothetical protein
MKISRIKNQISEAATEACGYSPLTKVISEEEVNRILEQESGWIPCSERLPEEHDSMFIKFKGTKKWSTAMFERKSDEVIVTVADDAGRTVTTSAHTTDGKWRCDLVRIPGYRIVAWMPLPEPYSADTEKPQTNTDRIRSMTDEELAEWFNTVTKDVLGGSTWNKKGWLKWIRAESEE